MDREILFRGRKTDGGGWIYGSIVQRANGQVFIAPVSIANRLVINAVDPATVGQYTGLKDRNGTRIFEGDVVAYEAIGVKRVLAIVIWLRTAWKLKPIGCSFLVELDSEDDLTIIGNIHDNPELMEGNA